METWQKIPFLDFYEASNKGNIRSLNRYVKHNFGGLKLVKGVVLKLSKQRNGYIAVPICIKGNEKRMLVHRLVCAAFLGECNLQVNHIDGNKENNNLENLEYCTPSQNIKHSFKIGLKNIDGENHPSSKFTNMQITEILNRCKNGERTCNLAKEFNVSPSTISNIKNGTNYKKVRH